MKVPNNQQPDRKIDDILSDMIAGVNSNPDTSNYIRPSEEESIGEARAALTALIEEEKRKTEKAYGGCSNCYGKGYATVNDRWAGTDEWTGKRYEAGSPNAMKFCDCERGKQLQARIEEERRVASKNPSWEHIEDFEHKVNVAARLNELRRLKNLKVSHNDPASVVVAYAAYFQMREDELKAALNPSHSEEGR